MEKKSNSVSNTYPQTTLILVDSFCIFAKVLIFFKPPIQGDLHTSFDTNINMYFKKDTFNLTYPLFMFIFVYGFHNSVLIGIAI